MTSQKIPFDRSIILEIFLVSRYSQVIAKTDTNGIDASNGPKNELCYAISDTNTIITDVITIFNIR